MSTAPVSKSQEVYLALRERIATGVYERAGGLPGEQPLAAEFGVSRVTLRRALSALTTEGFLRRRRGSGTFLAERPKPDALQVDLARAMAQLKSLSTITGVRLLSSAMEPAPAAVAAALRLPAGARVHRSVRVRLLSGEPFSYLVAYVPEALGATFTPQDLVENTLVGLLERAGCVIDHATQDIGAEAASPSAAEALGVSVGAPLLSLVRVAFTPGGVGVEYLRALYRPDRYTFRMDVGRMIDRDPDQWMPLSEPHIAELRPT